MRRFILSTFVLLLCCIFLNAQKRNESEAIQIAKKFFDARPAAHKARLATVAQSQLKARLAKHSAKAYQTASQNNCCYIINDEANNRFVIVSADERFYKVLGYSNNGIFDAEQAPCALLELLQGYNNQYDYMLRQEPNIPKVEQRSTIFPDIEPIVKARWGQRSPFNDECPYSMKGGHNCVSGCVATAMAQVMRHHRWPETGQGSYSYTARIDSTQSEALSIDFSTLHFNWDNVIDV